MHHHHALLLIPLLTACGPTGPEETTGDTTSSTTTDASTTASTTGTVPTTGDNDDCGPPPTMPACTPDTPSDPHSVLCAARDEAGCDGPLEDSIACKWVTTAVHPPDASTCTSAKPGGACIALSYYGDGCEVLTVCGGDQEGEVYFRTNAACETELFFASFCGEYPLGWSTCAWDQPATDSCAVPHPSAGPALCNCAC